MISNGVLRRIRVGIRCAFLLSTFLGASFSLSAFVPKILTLAWDASSDPSVVGYRLYFGTTSRSYTNMIDSDATSVAIPSLAPGATYYFAATTITAEGLESDYSVEASYTIPSLNRPPTLDPLSDVLISEGAAMQAVTLSGISSGASNEVQTLTISAFSSDPSLIPNPDVSYSSPDAEGTLSFTPVAGSFGTAIVTVMVDDGGSISNSIIRSFTVTVNPVNVQPTLNPINDLTINENGGAKTVALSGITSGSIDEIQTLTVSAFSSNPTLVPDPVLTYSSPNPSGTLTISPLSNAVGSATITVVVNDGQPINSTITRVFNVTINPTTSNQALLTNAVVLPNSLFRFILAPPFITNHKIDYVLGADAPTGSSILTRKGVTSLLWIPSFSQASSTNLFTVQITDKVGGMSTNQMLRVVVLDYLSVGAGSTSVQAGQNAILPLYLSSSEGVTNVTFTVDWPSTRFLNPTLTMTASGILSSSLQNQTTNLLIKLQTMSGQPILGSNLIGQLRFQTSANQASAFVSLPVHVLSGTKPNASNYAYYAPQPGEVVVVNAAPLLQPAASTNLNRSLTLFGKVGTSYQLQYSTNLTSNAVWYRLFNYTQTNLSQTVSVDGTIPLVFYRILQQ